MAGDWLKMRSNLWDDPRVSRIVDLTDSHEGPVIGALYWLWSMADQHTEDGFLPGMTLRQIDRKTSLTGFGQALCDIGWMSVSDDGVTIVRFEEHNGSSAKRRCADAKRKSGVRNVSASDADKARTNTGRDADEMRRPAELEKEKEKRYSEAKASGVEPPTNREILFANGVPLLMAAGVNEKSARSMLAGLCKTHGDDAVVSALEACAEAQPVEPVSWLQKVLGAGKRSGKSAGSAAGGGPRCGTDEYFAAHRNAAWWRDAGFGSVYEAHNARCWHHNAHQFRDGRRLEVEA